MLLQSENLEERRLFTYEERKATLRRSGGVCASCGKKLTTKTMTMDHIIPLSRGGTNEPENLVALCEECNKEKGSLLQMPRSCYMAVKNNNELVKMEKHVEKWFRTVKDQFDIERFPLIAPVTHMQLTPELPKNKKSHIYVPSFMLNWRIINPEYYEEIEAVTEINIREIRKNLPKINTFYKEDENGAIPTVAIYSLRKNTTDKILAIVAVQICLEQNHVNIYVPWCEMPKQYQKTMLFNFISLLFDTVIRIAEYNISTYTVINTTANHKLVDDFGRYAMKYRSMGYSFEYYTGKDLITGGDYQETLNVNRYNIREEALHYIKTQNISKKVG